MKLSWSCGHDNIHTGVYSDILHMPEHKIARDVVIRGTELIRNMNLKIEVFTPYFSGIVKSAGAVLNQKIKAINESKSDFAIESHFNGFSSPTAKGCETIYFSLPGVGRFSKKGKKLAECIHNNTLDILNKKRRADFFIIGVYDRGLKGMGDIIRDFGKGETNARFAFLTKTKMPALILEPLFITNENDCIYLKKDYQGEITRLAFGVVNGLIQYCEENGVSI
jgi:N-acetylmuramoyl-L-alanine amidase